MSVLFWILFNRSGYESVPAVRSFIACSVTFTAASRAAFDAADLRFRINIQGPERYTPVPGGKMNLFFQFAVGFIVYSLQPFVAAILTRHLYCQMGKPAI